MSWRYRRHPALCYTVVGREAVVLHLATRRYFTVSETGLDILEALQAEETAETLTALLVARYDVTPQAAAESVQAFLDRCVGSELVLVESPTRVDHHAVLVPTPIARDISASRALSSGG
ncbi:MAG TPA: PqqD family protein [Gemmatimonadales bacterium]